jgi:phospholipase/carboxylesterase
MVEDARKGRLLARPVVRVDTAVTPPGLSSLGLAAARDGYLYVPAGYQARRPAPLVVVLHGAPSSREYTWDLVARRGRYGPDVAAIDRALEQTFSRCAVDPARIAIGGYSDGASYALSLGLANGDLFTHVLAFSPGFAAPPGQTGSPRVFVSHGTRDGWLPIERCSRRIVPQLERAGYEVRYHEFVGGHVVPPEIGREAADWFTEGQDQ